MNDLSTIAVSVGHYNRLCAADRAFDDLCTKYLELRTQDCAHPGFVPEYEKTIAWNAHNMEREKASYLSDKLYAAEGELENLRANYKALCTQNEGLKAEQEEWGHSNAALLDKYNTVKAELAGLRTWNNDYEVERENLREEIDILDVKLNAFREENSRLGTENEMLRNHLGDARGTRDAHHVEIQALRAERNDLAMCAEARLQSLEEVDRAYDELEAKLEHIQDERDQLLEKYESAKRNYNDVWANQEILRNKFRQLNSEHEGLRISYDELEHRCDALRRGVSAREATISELMQAVDAALEIEDCAWAPNVTKTDRLLALAHQCKARAAENEELRTQALRDYRERDEFKRLLTLAEHNVDQLEDEAHNYRSQIHELRHGGIINLSAYQSVCAECDALRTENSELRARFESHSYHKDYFELSASYDTLKLKYEDVYSAWERLKVTCRKLRSDDNKLRIKYDALRTTLAAALDKEMA